MNNFNLLQQQSAGLFRIEENEEKIPNEIVTPLDVLQCDHSRAILKDSLFDTNLQLLRAQVLLLRHHHHPSDNNSPPCDPGGKDGSHTPHKDRHPKSHISYN